MSLVSRLRAGEALLTAWSGLPDALTVEAVAHLGFDAVTLDMQHGGHHEDSVHRSLVAIAHCAKPSIVRIPVGRFDVASRVLDFGADAVIAPMVNSVEDARRFAAAMKYPPVGERSWGPHRAMALRGIASSADHLGTANADTLAFAMIETRSAFEAVDGILGVEGIDGAFVGPSDFSIAWSGGKTIDPSLEDMMEAVAKISQRAKAAGKLAAIYVGDPALCGRFYGMGYRLFALGNESRYMAVGAENLIETARRSMK